MGFGVLFFGCFLTYFGAITPIGTFTYMLGAAIMLYALYKLSEINKMFLVSAVVSFAFLILSLAIVVMFIFGYDNNSVYNVLCYIQNFLSPVLLIGIHVAIYLVSKEVGLSKIQGWSIVNSVFILIGITVDVLSVFISSVEVLGRFGIVWISSRVLYSVFMLIIIFNCYAKICYEDDKYMDDENTGMPLFDFLNRLFNKATDKNRKNVPKDKGDK